MCSISLALRAPLSLAPCPPLSLPAHRMKVWATSQAIPDCIVCSAYKRMHTYARTHTDACTHAHKHTRTQTNTHTYAHAHKQRHTNVHTHTHKCTFLLASSHLICLTFTLFLSPFLPPSPLPLSRSPSMSVHSSWWLQLLTLKNYISHLSVCVQCLACSTSM